MFLGAVSVAKERQAQAKTAPAAAVTSPVVFTIITGLDDEELVFLKKSEHHKAKRGENGPLLYGGGTGAPGDLPAPSREIIMSYFQVCSELMLDPESIEHILGQAESTGRALQQVAMEFQRGVMEFNFLIEPNAGCTYLSKLTNLFPSDHELIEAAKAFMFTCLRSFLEAIKLRSTRIKVLRATGGFSKLSMMEFFEACNAKMAMPETKLFLKSIFAKTGKLPGEPIIEIQRALLERFGVTAEYGVSQLNLLSSPEKAKSGGSDPELMGKMRQFAMGAETAMKEATMTPAEHARFYADVPPFMHHVPYMFVYQKQQQMMSDMQNQQMMLADQLEAIKRNPASVVKMQDFARKVKDSRDTMDVSTWNAEQRSQYYADFQSDPLLLEIVNAGSSLGARLNKFSTLSDEQTNKLVRLSAVINEDVRARGNIFQSMSKGGALQNVLQSWGMLVRTGFQSIAEGEVVFTGNMMSGRSMDPDHRSTDGGHVHGPNCKHGPATMMDHDHDVSYGDGAQMER